MSFSLEDVKRRLVRLEEVRTALLEEDARESPLLLTPGRRLATIVAEAAIDLRAALDEIERLEQEEIYRVTFGRASSETAEQHAAWLKGYITSVEQRAEQAEARAAALHQQVLDGAEESYLKDKRIAELQQKVAGAGQPAGCQLCDYEIPRVRKFDAADRVVKLAANMASYVHHSGYPVYDGGHSEPEHACLHPDCVAVQIAKAALAAAGRPHAE